jgi:hypothetical protein
MKQGLKGPTQGLIKKIYTQKIINIFQWVTAIRVYSSHILPKTFIKLINTHWLSEPVEKHVYSLWKVANLWTLWTLWARI